MRKKFAGKYRIESARMQHWDYGSNGMYYITICTGGRKCYFGNIKDKNVKLSEIGIFADKFWLEIPAHFHYVKLDQYIIMPDHIHGIIIIDKPPGIKNNPHVETVHAPSLIYPHDINKNQKMARISPKQGTLATIIRSYKSVVTKNARHIDPGFAWQSRFYDHVIRNRKSLDRIRNYIKENPGKWKGDKFNPPKQ